MANRAVLVHVIEHDIVLTLDIILQHKQLGKWSDCNIEQALFGIATGRQYSGLGLANLIWDKPRGACKKQTPFVLSGPSVLDRQKKVKGRSLPIF